MKAIVLAAGYATRLYPLTLSTPKALLGIGGRPILDYIHDEIETIEDIDEVFIVSNQKFYRHFVEWKDMRNTKKVIKLINDRTMSEEKRLGAIGDMNFVINKENVRDDVMILAGDTFFTFKLRDFYQFYLSVGRDCICVHPIDDMEDLKRMGVVCIDDNNNKVIHFEEKPEHPKSNIAAFAVYIYRKNTLSLIDEYMKSGNKPDAPGYLTSWLYSRIDIYAYLFNGDCYDIGTHDSYQDVKKKFEFSVKKI